MEQQNGLNEEIAQLTERIAELRSQLVELEEQKLLQDVGLYEPMYVWATSEEYKAALDDVRHRQKAMIREKTAAMAKKLFALSGDYKAGERFTKGIVQHTLMTFNAECENAVSAVKFGNYESMKARIQKVFDKLNKLNEINTVAISEDYLHLKLEELDLAYSYAQKVQEEKEYAREQRAIQRENAKVQREMEEARRKLEKEQTHYQNMMVRLEEQLASEQSAGRREFIEEKISAAKDELISIEKAIADVDYRQANERAGYVYVISNIGAFGDGVYKIGMTRRLEPLDRIDELSGASVPFRFDVHALIFSSDAPKLETALHNAFADRRVNMVNGRKEFFRVPLAEIEKVVRENHDRTVEFTYTATAQQYRESLAMQKRTT